MEPTQEFVDHLFRLKIEAARRRPEREKFLDGARLRDIVRKRNLAGIRGAHPGASEEEVLRIHRERQARLQRLQEVRP